MMTLTVGVGKLIISADYMRVMLNKIYVLHYGEHQGYG